MANELSIELREYLKRCGLSERKIARCNGNTRMYHDLGLYGDIAEAYMEELADHYHVDLSGFEFDKFFPMTPKGTPLDGVYDRSYCSFKLTRFESDW